MKIDTNAGITFESAMDMLLTLKNAGLVTTTESKAIRNRILDKL